ncbi:MAG: RNA methyltransferase [Candidatus Korobacteraceae bacterium]|jgi:TrmH family RNA methyltransferase
MSQAYSNPPHERLRLIASRQNSFVKDLRRAFSQAIPNDDGSVAIEGVKLVEEAIRSGLRLRAVFFSESARPGASGRQRSVTRPSAACVQRANRLLPQLGHNTETILLPDDIFHSAVATETPQGVAALIYPLVSTLENLFRPAPAAGSSAGPHPPSFGECGDDARSLAAPLIPAPLILGCAGLQDPGNFGTILRSAEAFGATGVLATEGTVSAANPKVARASAGSLFRLPVIKLTTAEALAALAQNGIRLAVTSSHKGRPVHEVDLTLPTAIFIGSEGLGVPRALLDRADDAILIPHSPKVESLNAAIAASILLYEAQRQRSPKP